MGDPVTSPAPPSPPRRTPRVVLTTMQWIALPIIAAFPVLAAFGVFGERSSTASASSRTVDVRAAYPARFRYRQIQPLRVTVRNRSRQVLDTVFVSFDTGYISKFSSVRFDPPLHAAYVVPLTNLTPDATGLVAVELWGEQYGRHRGRIVVRTGADSVAIPMSTLVFP